MRATLHRDALDKAREAHRKACASSALHSSDVRQRQRAVLRRLKTAERLEIAEERANGDAPHDSPPPWGEYSGWDRKVLP